MHKLTKETLDDERLRSAVDEATYNRGKALFDAGEVTVNKTTIYSAECSVIDRRTYHVEIKVKDNYLYLKCNCTHASRGLICEHEMAACIGTRSHLIGKEPPKWRSRMERLVRIMHSSNSIDVQPYFLFFSLQKDLRAMKWKVIPYHLQESSLPLELRGQNVLGNPIELHNLIRDHDLIHRLKISQHNYNPDACLNCQRDGVTLANVIRKRARDERLHFLKPPLDDYLALLSSTQTPLYFGDYRDPIRIRLELFDQLGELGVQLSHDDDGLSISPVLHVGTQRILPSNENLDIVHDDPLWLLIEDQLFELNDPSMIDLISNFGAGKKLHIPTEGIPIFQNKYYQKIAHHIPIEGNVVSWYDLELDPQPRIYLSDDTGELNAELRFAYDETELGYDTDLPPVTVRHEPDTWNLLRIHRQSNREIELHERLAGDNYGLKRFPTAPNPGVFKLRARVHPVDFMLKHIPRLARDGFVIYGEQDLKTARVNRSTPTISFNISSGIDWFDVNAVVNFGELEVSLKDVRKVMRKQQRFIKLADETIGEIPQEWFEKFKHLFSLGEARGDGLRFSRFQLTVIENTMQGVDNLLTDEQYKDQIERLRHMRSMDFSGIAQKALPNDFNGELRPYQKAGFDWLHFLREYRFGGCLADDMGLGKTIQALAFLHSLYCSQQPAPRTSSLLVVPRSLLANWQREAARFAPQLRVKEYFSSKRVKDLKTFQKTDIVITTYGVMLRDIEFLHRYTFHYVILDESQSIKNPLSQTARASRLLQSDHRLVLTGTPIENSTVELWSQFAFLNPGLLGKLQYFKTEFGTPIERDGDSQAAELLRQIVYPFILRRTKDQVAPELPPRSERTLICDMQPAQRKLYNRTREYYRGMLLGMIEGNDLNHSRLKILEGLLRLRQICNHPRLVESKFRGASGKFDLLFETLETLQAEGHKALVFSQFVQMLSLVRSGLEERDITYSYLDGSIRDRQDRVDQFQDQPDIPFFLISLKAGGLGLNLTAADYVIHIDPWWNPAVEMQASDRTHRIGQDKPVFIYKLITRDSVEEKIVQLQERKKELVDQIITTEASFFKSLSGEDIEVLFS